MVKLIPLVNYYISKRIKDVRRRGRRLERFKRKQQKEGMFMILLLLIGLLHHFTVIQNVWVKERSCTWWNEIVSKFSDDEWHENFRMSKSTFMYIEK